MARKKPRSRGMRPLRGAVLLGVASIASALLVLRGAMDMRATGASGSPYLALGLFPALLCPIAFVYYAFKAASVRAMRRGTAAIARWTLSAEEFGRFREADERLSAETRTTNFYEPPERVPADGVEVIFADDGVLIGDRYFPLSTKGGRRVHRVGLLGTRPPMLEFGTILETRVRTSSTTSKAVRTAETLRVPVAPDATLQAEGVAGRYQAMAASRSS